MSQSLVAVFWGGRGSGKTLTMTAWAALALIAGKNVWSNYKIAFRCCFPSGTIHYFESKPVDVNDLLMIQRKDIIRNGLVMLDEWNLWCNSRRSGANMNYIFNGVVQLIRKRNLSFYITVQQFHSLDRFIRGATDLSILCHDRHFSNRAIPPGHVIDNEMTDVSGALTGRAVWDEPGWREQWEKNTRSLTLRKGKLFWQCYDSGFEYDILDVMQTRIQMERKTVTIGLDGLPDTEGGFRGVLAKEKLTHWSNLFPDGTTFTRDEFYQMLREEGIDADMKGPLGKYVHNAGFQRVRNYKGETFYRFDKKRS